MSQATAPRPAAPCACCGTTQGTVSKRTGRYRRLRKLCDRCYIAESKAGRRVDWPRTKTDPDIWLDDFRRLVRTTNLSRAEIAHKLGLTLDALDRALVRARARGDERAVYFEVRKQLGIT